MPKQLRRTVNAAENGSLQVGMWREGFERNFHRVEPVANRIGLGVIAATFINGLAVLLSGYHPPGLERWAGVAFAFGVGCATLLGIYLVWSMLRTRRN